ncbi:MAG: YybH family protein [Gemmatimonadaceae bacterium]
MRRTLAAVTGILIAVSAQSHAALSQQQQGERAPQVSMVTRTEILTFVRGYVDAHNRADATALSDAVSHRADVTSVGDGTITRGWDAIRAETDQITGKEGSFRFDVGTMDVVPLGTSYVLVVAPTTVTMSTQQGPTQVAGAFTLVLEKGREGWKVLNEHYSSKRQ